MIGDFNTKIGMITKGKNKTVTQGVWQLIQLVYKEEIITVNEGVKYAKNFGQEGSWMRNQWLTMY